MKKSVSIGLLIAAAAFLWTAGSRHTSLVRMRADYSLASAEPLENAPPMVAFTTVVLAGFRGLIADILWLRASYLQDSGKYIELVQLSDWITKLEPRCTEIWGFHAWNMAYNVSVIMAHPEDRWRWVRHGLHLLRDKGMAYNPGDPRLYFELGWIFLHKIGGSSDSAHGFYKRQWADEMHRLFSGPAPDYARMDSDPALRRRAKDEYGLTPDLMREVDALYGPLDWRLPQTHAVYWGHAGVKRAGREETFLCERLIAQAMVQSFKQGRLLAVEAPDGLVITANLEVLENTRQVFERTMARHRDENVAVAYLNFLREAVVFLYAFDRPAQARTAYGWTGERFPCPQTSVDFTAFVSNSIAEMTGDEWSSAAETLTEGFLYRGYVHAARGDTNQAAAAEAAALQYWGRGPEQQDSGAGSGHLALAQVRMRARERARADQPPAAGNRQPSGAEMDGGNP